MNFKGRSFFITIIIYGTLMKHITDPINTSVGFNTAGIPPTLNLTLIEKDHLGDWSPEKDCC